MTKILKEVAIEHLKTGMEALRSLLSKQSHVAGIPKSLTRSFLSELVEEEDVNMSSR